MSSLIGEIGSFFSHFTPGGIVSGALTLVAATVTPYILNMLHLSAQDNRRAYIQDAIKNALAYAVSVAAKNPQTVDLIAIKDDIIEIAQAYMKELVPQGLAELQISDSGLGQLLEVGLVNDLDNLSALL